MEIKKRKTSHTCLVLSTPLLLKISSLIEFCKITGIRGRVLEIHFDYDPTRATECGY